MPAVIDQPLRFSRVRLTDVRIQRRGASLDVLADFAYIDEDGTTFGKGSYNVLMDETARDALYEFIKAGEEAIVRAITVPVHEVDPLEDFGESNAFMETDFADGE